MLPAVAVLRSQMATPELSPKRRLSTITKKDAKGKEVPKDVVRRMEAEAEDPNNGVDRPLQLACIAAIVVPILAVLICGGILIGVLVWCCCCKDKKKPPAADPSSGVEIKTSV